MSRQLSLIVCENFRCEAAQVVAQAGFQDVRVIAFPATCIRPQIGQDMPSAVATAALGRGDAVMVLGGYCLSCLAANAALRQAQDADFGPPDGQALRVMRCAQCQELVVDASLIEMLIRQGAYLLTPGWLAHWRRYLQEWGFDQPTAREFFTETTRKLTLLDTGSYRHSREQLQAFANFLALPAETLPVGLDLFQSHVIRFVSEWRPRQIQRKQRLWQKV